jgi:hypothetical protein
VGQISNDKNTYGDAQQIRNGRFARVNLCRRPDSCPRLQESCIEMLYLVTETKSRLRNGIFKNHTTKMDIVQKDHFNVVLSGPSLL